MLQTVYSISNEKTVEKAADAAETTNVTSSISYGTMKNEIDNEWYQRLCVGRLLLDKALF